MCSRCKKFNFLSNVQEQYERKECKVEIPDFDIIVLTEMLRYMYTEKVQNIEQYSHDNLLIIANKYALEGLKLKCEAFLCNKIC